jgi:hypothetical protein
MRGVCALNLEAMSILKKTSNVETDFLNNVEASLQSSQNVRSPSDSQPIPREQQPIPNQIFNQQFTQVRYKTCNEAIIYSYRPSSARPTSSRSETVQHYVHAQSFEEPIPTIKVKVQREKPPLKKKPQPSITVVKTKKIRKL